MSNLTAKQIEQKIHTITVYGQSLVGAPYRWWVPDHSERGISYVGAPFYADDKTYSSEYVMKHGVNCAGLVNLLAREIGIESKGGALMWMGLNVLNLELFESDKIETYPKGSLLFREYRSDTDQGHMAIYTGDNQILHAYPNSSEVTEDLVSPGVTIEPIANSLSWSTEPFYDHVLKPEHWLES
jgi:cell wall-associated NlpC family hydrolase